MRKKIDHVLREMNTDDISGVINLLRVCNLYWEVDDTPEHFMAKLTQDKDLMIVAVVENKIVGFVMASFDGWAAIVWHFGILSEFRGSNIYSALANEIKNKLRQRGLKNGEMIYCLVMKSNSRMIQLLEHYAFRKLAEVHIMGRPI